MDIFVLISAGFGIDKQRYYTDGVVTGTEKLKEDPLCFLTGFTILGGSLSEAYARKITKIMDLAMKTVYPL